MDDSKRRDSQVATIGLEVRHPELTFATPDYDVSTLGNELTAISEPFRREIVGAWRIMHGSTASCFGLATGARAQPDGSVASNGRLPYRVGGPDRYKVMTLATDEFIRRFLIHVLPKGFHRIRHYGLFAKAACADNIARAR